MRNYLWVAVGGALGSVARYWLSGLVANWRGETFPWGTLVINVTGSFLIGLFATATAPGARGFAGPELRTFLMVGICGGYTTFSAFSLQTLSLAEGGEWLKAGANVLGSVAFCLFAVWLGHALALQLGSAKGS